MDHIQRLSEVFVEMASLVRPQLWINRELVAAADDDAATNEQQQRERSSQSAAAGFILFILQFWVNISWDEDASQVGVNLPHIVEEEQELGGGGSNEKKEAIFHFILT